MFIFIDLSATGTFLWPFHFSCNQSYLKKKSYFFRTARVLSAILPLAMVTLTTENEEVHKWSFYNGHRKVPMVDRSMKIYINHPRTIYIHPVKWRWESPSRLGGVRRQRSPRQTCDRRTDRPTDRQSEL